ncbi:MAG TPA: DUF3488 and transglutaminase-like domain-containing protein [Gammaproteobacteria bacterium]
MNAPGASRTRGRLIWSAAVIVGASLPHWLVLPPWMPLLLCACVIWRLEGERRRWPMPGRGLRILLAFLALAVVLTRYRTVNGVEAGSALLVVMVALKFLEASTHRDQLVLMIIAYFLVFASLLTQQSLLIGAYLVAFVFVTTAGLLQLARRGSLRPAGATCALAARMLLQALPVMLVLFVLFPRLSGPLWALPTNPQRGTTGLDDRLSPGDLTALGESDEVAFRVEFFGARPSPEELYWRGPVLSSFDGRTWSRAWTGRGARPGAVAYLGEPTEYRVMLEPNGRGWTFALDMPREWSGVDRMIMTRDFQLLVPFGREIGSRLDYRVVSHTRYRTLEPLGAGERLRLTRLPEGSNPRTRALVRGWLARGMGPESIVAEALRFFREQPFRYTLTPPALGEHTADEFLFETRAGFCEHYASAFVVMMRAAGIPARVVTGYQGGELNAFGEYYVVRQSDAHAWAEVWLADRGWTRVDPTAAVAPERIELGAAGSVLGGEIGRRGFGMLRTARQAWDAVNTYWYGWVVGYGNTAQRLLLERLGFEWATPAVLTAAAAAGIALILALFSACRAFTERRRKRLDPAARWFAILCRRLARRGVAPIAAGEGPAAYAARAEQALPAAAPAIRTAVAAYLRARYEPDADGRALERLERLVKAFRPA